ncbi:MAG TPA: amidohydrolase family protein, partial [Spirochaetota bacterium]|nr:amidohydrolase family protein [Spirochaetota bacterium]
NPVIVLNLSLHGMVMNRAAEDFLNAEYSDIAANHRDPIWVERHLPRILRMVPCIVPPADEDIKSFCASLRETGIGEMEDMLLPEAKWLDVISSAPLPIHTWADEEIYNILTRSEKEKVMGVKLFTDGALGTCTAALSQPYLSGEQGVLLSGEDEFTEKVYGFMKDGAAPAIHAIGDMAVEMAVNAVKTLRKERGCSGPVRIEHVQFISKEAAFTAKNAGITLSMQPNFNSDSVIYTDRLPRGFAAMNNPFRMLIDEAGFVPGKDLIFGSDGMPHGIRPALKAALFPPFPGQALSVPEFIEGYCMKDMEDEWMVEVDGTDIRITSLQAR